MVNELQKKADYYIDLHSGDDYEKLTPYVYYAGKADPEVTKISRQMAEQVDSMEVEWQYDELSLEIYLSHCSKYKYSYN